MKTITKEEKDLLLKDLCARLPYGVKYRFTDKDSPDFELSELGSIMKYWIEEGKVLPYLRPMSSMTEKEQKEFVQFHCVKICPIVITDSLTIENESKMIDWLNANHFDYRGLIPMGLAIEAPEEMYSIK